jgi:hypothetical protein
MHLSTVSPFPSLRAEKIHPSRSLVLAMPNNSLERTQPQRDFKYDVAVLRRSARSRYAAFLLNAWIHQ